MSNIISMAHTLAIIATYILMLMVLIYAYSSIVVHLITLTTDRIHPRWKEVNNILYTNIIAKIQIYMAIGAIFLVKSRIIYTANTTTNYHYMLCFIKIMSIILLAIEALKFYHKTKFIIEKMETIKYYAITTPIAFATLQTIIALIQKTI